MQRELQKALLAAAGRYIRKLFSDIEVRVKALEARPMPERGEPGLRGEKGADGLNGKDGRDGKDGLDGKDGAPGLNGKDGKDGEPGKPGLDGKSVTLEEVRTYLDAELATWALGFERRAQDVLQRAIDRMPAPKDGAPGLDGKDGFSLDDLQIDQRNERTVVLRFMRGDLVREHEIRLGHPLDQGVFREGTTYQRGDGVTFGGSWWIAQKDAPDGKPGVSSDWRLAVKKGRDGRDKP